MRPITPDTPRKDIKIGGVILKGPMPFAEGDKLEANEAASINQTYLENIGNNYRSAVEKAKRIAIAGTNDAEKVKAVTNEQLEAFTKRLESEPNLLDASALQSGLDEVVAGYKMGVRRSSSVEVLDPVEREARDMAKTMLRNALKKKGIKLNTVPAEWYDREIDKLLAEGNERGATIRKNAERRVKLANQVAADDLTDLDLSGSAKPKEEAAPTPPAEPAPPEAGAPAA